MNVLVVGKEKDANALKCTLEDKVQVKYIPRHEIKDVGWSFDAVFDFGFSHEGEEVFINGGLGAVPVFLNCPFSTLRAQRHRHTNFHSPIFGFNGIQGLLTETGIELTALDEDKAYLARLCPNLFKVPYHIVRDRVGMVTPRVICMIINEAYYTVQEGTASKEDVDKGMKLGTNYPFGPFEWSERIGLQNVFTLLSALYEDTKEERYKVCPLLKEEYLKLIQP